MGRYRIVAFQVAALLNDKSTAVAQRWLGGQPAGELAISDSVITESSAALSMKLRTGEVEPPQRGDVLAFVTRLTEASFHVLPVSRQDFQTAARFADQYATRLGAGDALHLAIASLHGAGLHALDKHLVEIGQALGVDAALAGRWSIPQGHATTRCDQHSCQDTLRLPERRKCYLCAWNRLLLPFCLACSQFA